MAIRSKKPKPLTISAQAKSDINNILSYLSVTWSQKEIDNFLKKLETFYKIISFNPQVFGYFDKRKNIRKYTLTKQNIIYYRNRKSEIEIITVFDGRQNPEKLKNLIE